MLYAMLPALVGFLIFLYVVYLATFRLYLRPMANFPGSKLAALSLWYEFYYDIVLGSQYIKEIIRMHDEYDAIIRINPYELHIKDPDSYDTFYCVGPKRVNKWG